MFFFLNKLYATFNAYSPSAIYNVSDVKPPGRAKTTKHEVQQTAAPKKSLVN